MAAPVVDRASDWVLWGVFLGVLMFGAVVCMGRFVFDG